MLRFAFERSRNVELTRELHSLGLAPVGDTAINVQCRQIIHDQTFVMPLLQSEHDLDFLTYIPQHILAEKAKLFVKLDYQTRRSSIGIFDCSGNEKKRGLCGSELISRGKDGDLSKVNRVVIMPNSRTSFTIDWGG